MVLQWRLSAVVISVCEGGGQSWPAVLFSAANRLKFLLRTRRSKHVENSMSLYKLVKMLLCGDGGGCANLCYLVVLRFSLNTLCSNRTLVPLVSWQGLWASFFQGKAFIVIVWPCTAHNQSPWTDWECLHCVKTEEGAAAVGLCRVLEGSVQLDLFWWSWRHLKTSLIQKASSNKQQMQCSLQQRVFCSWFIDKRKSWCRECWHFAFFALVYIGSLLPSLSRWR